MSPYIDLCAFACLGLLVLAAAWVDWRRQIIPNEINAGLALCGTAYGAFTPHLTWSASVGGIAAGAGALWMLAAIFPRLRGYDGLGMGDVKFVAGAGAWVGWQGLAPLLMLASVAALLVILSWRILDGRPLAPTTRIPFAPFLGLALIVIWLAQAHSAMVPMGVL